MLQWGVPPLANMAFSGHTENSADLQTSLGYARILHNTGYLMLMMGMMSYFQSVIPGCIGAQRMDRIPICVRRSMVFVLIFMVNCSCNNVMHVTFMTYMQ